MPFYNYLIGAGWNVALGSLVNIENIKPTGDRKFTAPRALQLYDEGERHIRGNGLLFSAGFAVQPWLFNGLTRAQYDYLSSTYCSSGFSGKVTIYTRWTGQSGGRYNAVMVLPKPADLGDGIAVYKEVRVLMTRLTPSS